MPVVASAVTVPIRPPSSRTATDAPGAALPLKIGADCRVMKSLALMPLSMLMPVIVSAMTEALLPALSVALTVTLLAAVSPDLAAGFHVRDIDEVYRAMHTLRMQLEARPA